jgi:hypothetical protein
MGRLMIIAVGNIEQNELPLVVPHLRIVGRTPVPRLFARSGQGHIAETERPFGFVCHVMGEREKGERREQDRPMNHPNHAFSLITTALLSCADIRPRCLPRYRKTPKPAIRIFLKPDKMSPLADRNLIAATSKAALAAGADGILVEVHPSPDEALCDGDQSLSIEEFRTMMDELRPIVTAVGKRMARPK